MGARGESARRALVGDAPAVAALAADFVTALESARGGDALVSWVRPLGDADTVAALIANADHSVFVVGLYEEVIAGFAHAIVRGAAGVDKRVEIEAMYIDPPLRRVGVGEAMIGEVASYASDENASSIDVVALPGDGATKSFLEATGFRTRLLVMNRLLTSGEPSIDEPTEKSALTVVPCVGVVDVEDGALLLIRRRDPPSAGRWTLPGGRVEPGEALRDAARREALEETGLDLEIGDLLGSTEIDAPPERFLVCDYLAQRREPASTPTPGDDALDVRFVPLEDVLDLDLVDGVGDWLVDRGVVRRRH